MLMRIKLNTHLQQFVGNERVNSRDIEVALEDKPRLVTSQTRIYNFSPISDVAQLVSSDVVV